MKKNLGISIIMMAVVIVSFAGGLKDVPEGALLRDVAETVKLEKDYQLLSLINHAEFSKEQLEEMANLVDDTKEALGKNKEKAAKDLEEAVELMKAGDIEEANERHDSAFERREEIQETLENYSQSFKEIVTLKQAELMQDYFMQARMKSMKNRIGKLKAPRSQQGKVRNPMSGFNPERMEQIKERAMSQQKLQQFPEKAKEVIREKAGDLRDIIRTREPRFDLTRMILMGMLENGTSDLIREYAGNLEQ